MYNDVNDPILLGIVPDTLLKASIKYVNDDNNPILLGILPANRFDITFRDVNSVNNPILPGIVPDILLLLISKYVSDVNNPILLGIVPANDRLDNIIDVTLSYVADPLTVPHVTPW